MKLAHRQANNTYVLKVLQAKTNNFTICIVNLDSKSFPLVATYIHENRLTRLYLWEIYLLKF